METTTLKPLTAHTLKILEEFKDCFESKESTKTTRINTKGVADDEFFKNVGENLSGVGYFR